MQIEAARTTWGLLLEEFLEEVGAGYAHHVCESVFAQQQYLGGVALVYYLTVPHRASAMVDKCLGVSRDLPKQLSEMR